MTDTTRLERPAADASTGIGLTRRKLLRAAGLAAVAAPAIIGSRAFAGERKLSFAWNAGAFGLAPVVAALDRGFFEKNGPDVELINYTGSTDQLLESLATGKADAAVGMIHRWLKPLEAGLAVKIVASSGQPRVRGLGQRHARAGRHRPAPAPRRIRRVAGPQRLRQVDAASARRRPGAGHFMAQRVIVLGTRPARIIAAFDNDLPYPRHRGHPRLAELRHEALRLLGLDESW